MKKITTIDVRTSPTASPISVGGVTNFFPQLQRYPTITERVNEADNLSLRFLTGAPFAEALDTTFKENYAVVITYDDASEAYFFVKRSRQPQHGQPSGVEADQAEFVGLKSRVIRINRGTTFVDTTDAITAQTSQTQLNRIVSATYGVDPLFIAGTVDAALAGVKVPLEVNGLNHLQALHQLRQRLTAANGGKPAELEFSWNGTKFVVDLVTQAGLTAAEKSGGADPTLRPIDSAHEPASGSEANRLRLTREIDGRQYFTRVIPRGNTKETPITVGQALFPITSLVFSTPNTTITLVNNAWPTGINIDTSLFFGNDTVGFFAIVSTTAPNQVVVTGDASALTNGRLSLDATGRELIYVEHVDGVTGSTVEKILDRFDIGPFANLLKEAGGISVDMSVWATDKPQGFVKFGATLPTVTQVFDDEHARYGDAAAKVVCTVKDSGLSVSVTVAPTDKDPHFSHVVNLFVEAGSVRVYLKDAGGARFPLTDGESNVAGLREVRLEGLDLPAGVVTLFFEAKTATTTFYLDAVNLTQSASAYPYRDQMGPVALWLAGVDELLEEGGTKVKWFGDALDVSKFDDVTFAEIRAGSHCRIRSHWNGSSWDYQEDVRVKTVRYFEEVIDQRLRKTIEFEESRPNAARRFTFEVFDPMIPVVPDTPVSPADVVGVQMRAVVETVSDVRRGVVYIWITKNDALIAGVLARGKTGDPPGAGDAFTNLTKQTGPPPAPIDEDHTGDYYRFEQILSTETGESTWIDAKVTDLLGRTIENRVFEFASSRLPKIKHFSVSFGAYDLIEQKYPVFLSHQNNTAGLSLEWSIWTTPKPAPYVDADFTAGDVGNGCVNAQQASNTLLLSAVAGLAPDQVVHLLARARGSAACAGIRGADPDGIINISLTAPALGRAALIQVNHLVKAFQNARFTVPITHGTPAYKTLTWIGGGVVKFANGDTSAAIGTGTMDLVTGNETGTTTKDHYSPDLTVPFADVFMYFDEDEDIDSFQFTTDFDDILDVVANPKRVWLGWFRASDDGTVALTDDFASILAAGTSQTFISAAVAHFGSLTAFFAKVDELIIKNRLELAAGAIFTNTANDFRMDEEGYFVITTASGTPNKFSIVGAFDKTLPKANFWHNAGINTTFLEHIISLGDFQILSNNTLTLQTQSGDDLNLNASGGGNINVNTGELNLQDADLRIEDGATTVFFVDESGHLVELTNADLHILAGFIEMKEITAPGAPAAGGRLYPKTGQAGLFWHKFGQAEVDLTASGGGAVAGLDKEIQINVAGAFGTDPLFVFDYINNRLGIGTTVIDEILHVEAATGLAKTMLKMENTGPVRLNFTNTGASSIDKVWILRMNNSGDFVFGHDGADQMIIRDDGNVGIGTAIPAEKLDVVGTVKASVGMLVGANTVWHAGNDGAGSGLDADLLDGLDSLGFLRSDVSDNFTAGVLNIDAAADLYVLSNNGLRLKELTGDPPTSTAWFNLFARDDNRLYVNMGLVKHKLLTDQDAIDAGLLDGLDSLQFLRSDVADTATALIIFDAGLRLNDNKKIELGTSAADSEIYSDGFNTIFNTKTGNFEFWHDKGGADNDQMLILNDDGSVELFDNGAKKLNTNVSGVEVTGQMLSGTLSVSTTASITGKLTMGNDVLLPDGAAFIAGAGLDLQIFHNAGVNEIKAVSGDLHIKSTGTALMAIFKRLAEVELYFNNAIKAETHTSGLRVYGGLGVGQAPGTANRVNVERVEHTSTLILNGQATQLGALNPLILQNDTDDFIRIVLSAGDNFEISGLPTSAPTGSNKVWNDAGTLKIT